MMGGGTFISLFCNFPRKRLFSVNKDCNVEIFKQNQSRFMNSITLNITENLKAKESRIMRTCMKLSNKIPKNNLRIVKSG